MSKSDDDKPPFYFEGFDEPNYTQVPDIVFDMLAPNLTEAELRVLLYIIRRTFGFKKMADTISQNQMASGIRTRDGRQLDLGTGMSKSAVWRGCKGLVEKGVLVVEQRQSEQGDSDVNVYALRFRNGVSLQKSDPYSPKESPVSLQKSTQDTVHNTQLNKGRDRHKKYSSGEPYNEEERAKAIAKSAEAVPFDPEMFFGSNIRPSENDNE